jgi:hypothetical protein
MRTSASTIILDAAIAKAQASLKNPPKNKFNPHYKNHYADLASILETVLPIYSAQGVAISQVPHTDERGTWITTRVAKEGEWIESEYFVCAPMPQQKIASETTFAKRIVLQSILGCCGDDDDDGGAPVQPEKQAPLITAEQQKELTKLVEETASDLAGYLAYIGVSEIASIKAIDFHRAKTALLNKKGKP